MQPQPPPSLLPSIPPSLPPSSHGGRRPRSGYQLPGRRTLRHVLGQGMPPPHPTPVCLCGLLSFSYLIPFPPPVCLLFRPPWWQSLFPPRPSSIPFKGENARECFQVVLQLHQTLTHPPSLYPSLPRPLSSFRSARCMPHSSVG